MEIISALAAALEEELEVGLALEGEIECELRGDFCTVPFAFNTASNPANSYLDEPIDELSAAVGLTQTAVNWRNSTHGAGGGIGIQSGLTYRFFVQFEDAIIEGHSVGGTMILADGTLSGVVEFEV